MAGCALPHGSSAAGPAGPAVVRSAGALAMVLAGTAALWALTGPTASSAGQVGSASATGSALEGRSSTDELLDDGEALYVTGCSSCHGTEGGGVIDAEGERRGPSLLESGEASAYYYLHTGRMPLANSNDQAMRKDRAYAEDDIEALVAYVASLGDGPDLPEIDVAAGDLAEGGLLYRSNCQACHAAAGVGGALSYGRAAPNIHPAEPLEIAAAVRVGPGQMPGYDSSVFDSAELDSLVRYVQYLDQPADPGGASLGRVGPIPEGFVTWVIGLGALIAAIVWIGKLRREGELSG